MQGRKVIAMQGQERNVRGGGRGEMGQYTRHIGEEGVMARTGDDEIGSMSKDTTAVGE